MLSPPAWILERPQSRCSSVCCGLTALLSAQQSAPTPVGAGLPLACNHTCKATEEVRASYSLAAAAATADPAVLMPDSEQTDLASRHHRAWRDAEQLSCLVLCLQQLLRGRALLICVCMFLENPIKRRRFPTDATKVYQVLQMLLAVATEGSVAISLAETFASLAHDMGCHDSPVRVMGATNR